MGAHITRLFQVTAKKLARTAVQQLAPKVVTDPMPADSLREHGHAFCAAPFHNLSVAIGGVATPCCEFKGDCGNVKQQSIEDVWQGEAFREFRAKMLRDERDDRCSKCYEMEETGGYSLRKMFNTRQVGHADRSGRPAEAAGPADESLAPALPITLDIRFSNLCNFSCRMCGPAASSKWFSDSREMGWTPAPGALITTFTSTEAAIQGLRPLLPTIELIYFAGGEPLLLEQHYALLNELIQQGRTDVSLQYNSNVSELRLGRQDVLPLWSHFKDILIEASIDGSGIRGELIREGMSWSDFVANVRTIKQSCPHVRIQFGITVSVFNVWALPELYRDLSALGDPGEHDMHFHVLQEPKHYSIQILPRRIKRKIARRLEAYASEGPNDGAEMANWSIQSQFRHIIDHMMAEDHTDLIEKFREVTFKLDKMRNKSTAAICPELAPLLRPSVFPKLRRLAHRARYFPRRALRRLEISRQQQG
jgi:MoaA/NifB/PqqE/SkfB family radical SAM enzyme